jgi:hypothetical protein
MSGIVRLCSPPVREGRAVIDGVGPVNRTRWVWIAAGAAALVEVAAPCHTQATRRVAAGALGRPLHAGRRAAELPERLPVRAKIDGPISAIMS